MTTHFVSWFVFALAAFPAGLFVTNLFLYRAPRLRRIPVFSKVSVLIPARNEESTIAACLQSALNSRGVDLEVIVLDDQSEDRTGAIVGELASQDTRVRLLRGTTLPPGWCGKQHACSILAAAAFHPVLCFLDADVRLDPDSLAALASDMETRRVALLSGFPWQQTGTLSERLLIPLMHFILLGFLPIAFMRRSNHPSLSAGCGQLVMVVRDAYRRAGGHSAIRSSRHDGIALPAAFRRAGLRTDLCDLTNFASCRMYHGTKEVFSGLAKNATEGLGAPARILPFTLILLGGQVAPLILLALHPNRLLWLAVALMYLPRLLAVVRFRQSLSGALLHPVSIVLLLAIQWVALVRSWLGLPSAWKGRLYTPGAAS